LDIWSATMRALVSVGPPAAIGTIMWMGRSGHACACAARTMTAGAKIDAADSFIRRRRVIIAALRLVLRDHNGN
jgi:hypothetical protein